MKGQWRPLLHTGRKNTQHQEEDHKYPCLGNLCSDFKGVQHPS